MADDEPKQNPVSSQPSSASDEARGSDEGKRPTGEGTSSQIKKRSHGKTARSGRRKPSGRGASALGLAPSGERGQQGLDGGENRNDQPASGPTDGAPDGTANVAQQASTSSSSPSVSPPAAAASGTEGGTDPVTPSTESLPSPRIQSVSSPELSDPSSEAERRLADLTVLRGRKLPLEPNELPLSPMVQREAAPKGRSVSIDPLPAVGVISPLSAIGSPEDFQSPCTDAPPVAVVVSTATPAAPPSREAPEKTGDSSRRQSVSSRRRPSTDSGKRAVICAPVLKVRRPSEADEGVAKVQLLEGQTPAAAEKQDLLFIRRSSQDERSRHGSLVKTRRTSSHRGRRGSRGSTQTGSSMGEQFSVRVRKHAASTWVLGCVVAILVLVVVGLVALIVENLMKPPYVVQRYPCKTEDCVEHARHILLTLNTSADPCSKFHVFVCGDGSSPGGKAAPSLHGEENSDSGLHSLRNLPSAWRLARHYAQVINSTIGNLRLLLSIRTTPAATVKAFSSFNLCLQRDNRGASTAFVEFMQKRDIPWPSKPLRRAQLVDVLDALLQLSIDWRASLWLDVRLWYPARRVKPPPLVVLDEPSHVSVLRMEQLGTLDGETYSSLVQSMACYLTDNSSCDAGGDEDLFNDPAAIEELRKDETAVRTAIISTLKAEDSYDDVVSLDRARFLLSNVSLEEWMDLLEKYLKPGGLEVSVLTAFLVQNKLQMAALSKLMSDIPAPRLLNVLGWTFAYSYSWIVNSSFDIFQKELPKDLNPNYVLCFVAVHESYGISMDAALFGHLFPEHERDKVIAVVNETANVLIGAVGASRSVLNATKSEAHAKIISLVSHEIWPSNLFLNFDALDSFYAQFPSGISENFYSSWLKSRSALREALSNRYHGTLMTSKLRWYSEMIKYVYTLNLMLIGFAAIFPPKYLTQGNHVMTYAGLGFQFARQMVKSVDERGRYLDYATGKNLSWWEENQACMLKKAQSTRERNRIKDLFALDIALTTLKKVSVADGSPLQLKLLEKLKPMQAFYISYCNHFCGHDEAQEMCDLATYASDFAIAFNCPRRTQHDDCIFV